jgi:hypothetical protein
MSNSLAPRRRSGERVRVRGIRQHSPGIYKMDGRGIYLLTGEQFTKSRISIMKNLIPFLAACLIASALLAGPSAPPVFQLRLALDTPSADSQPMPLITTDHDYTFTNLLYIQKTVLLDQTALKSVKQGKDARGQPMISIALTEAGAKQFAEVTRENIHKRLAIIIHGRIRSAPVIAAEISGGAFQISGSTLGKQEAQDLATEINSALHNK